MNSCHLVTFKKKINKPTSRGLKLTGLLTPVFNMHEMTPGFKTMSIRDARDERNRRGTGMGKDIHTHSLTQRECTMKEHMYVRT